jgi:hypothetical protein
VCTRSRPGRTWVDQFPRKTLLRPSAATNAVAGLVGPNGEPTPWPVVLDALRAFGRPSESVQRPVLTMAWK